MTKFAQFDKATLKALRAEMQEVMNKYAVKANLEIVLRRALSVYFKNNSKLSSL